MGRSEIRPSGVKRQSCNDQPPTGSKPLRSNLLSDTRCRGSPQAPLFPFGHPALGPVQRSAHYAGSGVLRGPSRGIRRSPLGAGIYAAPAPFRPSRAGGGALGVQVLLRAALPGPQGPYSAAIIFMSIGPSFCPEKSATVCPSVSPHMRQKPECCRQQQKQHLH